MGVVPSHMGDMCVCVGYSPKRQEGAVNTGRQSPSLFSASIMVHYKKNNGFFVYSFRKSLETKSSIE